MFDSQVGGRLTFRQCNGRLDVKPSGSLCPQCAGLEVKTSQLEHEIAR